MLKRTLITVFIGLVLFITIAVSILAVQSTYMSLQGRVTDQDGIVISNGNISVNITRTAVDCDTGVFWAENFTNVVQNGEFAILLGQTKTLELDFNRIYYMCVYVNDELVTNLTPFRGGQGQIDVGDINTTSDYTFDDVNITGNVNFWDKVYFSLLNWLSLDWLKVEDNIFVTGNLTVNGTITAGSVELLETGAIGVSIINLTSATFTGDIRNGSTVGYAAAHQYCAVEFTNSHLCSESEVQEYIANRNISLFTTGDVGWVGAGGAKYVPANHPVSDCAGFTNNDTGATDPMGNFWSFDNETGGQGVCGNCGLTYPLTCCR